MNTSFQSQLQPFKSRRTAFTIVELLVAVSLMTLIVFALYGMFSQTQRALQGNIAQVDVNESGRAAMELIVQELQEMSAAQIPYRTNFFVEMAASAPVWQRLVVSNSLRKNILQDFFFLSRRAKDWTGTGYRAIATNGVASLYRFSVSTNQFGLQNYDLSLVFRGTRATNLNFYRVADGIIHLRLLPYDTEGRPMTVQSVKYYYPPSALHQLTENGLEARGLWVAAPTNHPLTLVVRENKSEAECRYLGPALPAYVEVEMGVLEPQALEQFKSIPPNLAAGFLNRQAAKVQLFRQRVAIRTALP